MIPDIIVEAGAWDTTQVVPVIEKACTAVSGRFDLADWEAVVLLCDDDRIAELNAEFRDKPSPTNVLSWPSAERGAAFEGGDPKPPEPDMFGDHQLGDLALSYETCMREARIGNIDPHDHLMHLVIHGLLHLLGYDHETDSDADLMEAIEIELLAQMGIVNPYMIKD